MRYRFLPICCLFLALWTLTAISKQNHLGGGKPLLAGALPVPHLQSSTFTPLQGIVQLVSKRLHSCVLTPSGGVKCWGLNDNGRLGDNSTTFRTSAVNVVGLSSGVKTVYAGGHHTCALLNSGEVKCWGWNKDGEIGDGTTTDALTPVTVLGLGGAVHSLALGGSHTCALLTNGSVQCWGNNNEGELGSNTMSDYRITPETVVGLTSGVKAIVANAVHSCALLNNGSVQCWGGNADGQIGDGTSGSANHRPTPVQVIGLTSGVAQLWAGRDHNCVLMTSGAVKCWGLNASGQLGNGNTQNQSTPQDVSNLTGTVLELAGGGDHTCALISGGSIKCWGQNDSGQLGNNSLTNSTTPVTVVGLNAPAVAVTAGRRHTCALLNNNQVQCWGLNDKGQVGDGTAETPRKNPVFVVEAGTALPTLTLGAVTVSENAGSAVLTVNLSGVNSNPVTVNYATSDGTASAGLDYTAISGSLVFTAGVTSKSINIALLDDTLDEANETLSVTLSNPSNASLGTPANATVTINDDDLPPTVQFSQSSATVTENSGTATINVSLSAPSGRSITVNYQTSNGTATAGSDYTTSSGTLTFAPGETNKSFAVAILNDSLDELDETFQLILSNPVNATLGTLANHTLTISDDDPTPTVQLSGAAYSINENAGTALITVNLSQPSGRTVTVDYSTSNGTATAGSDYTATSGTLTFAPGETNRSFVVPILNDSTVESSETVNLLLNNAVNAPLGATVNAVLTIIDDDAGGSVPVKANFVAAPLTGVAPLTVQFTDQSTGPVARWLWNFGDGITSTVQNPSHLYLNPGDFTVQLRVDSTDGNSFSIYTASVQLQSSPAPVASFSASPTSGNHPLTVNFSDQSSGNPTAWLWNFGDGATSTQQNPTHTYTSPGSFTVALAVTAPGGQNATSQPNYILVNETPALAPDFTANPPTGVAPLVVSFTDLSTGAPTSWLWDFGDGATSTVQNPQHTYTTIGDYTVVLTVGRPGDSATTRKTNLIRVTQLTPPTANFSATLRTGETPLSVGFLDQSLGTVTRWSWSFGDGATSDLQNPTYTYTTPGDYTVSLTVVGPLGLHTKTQPNYIRVRAVPPPPQLDLNPLLGAGGNGDFTIAWAASGATATYELQEQFNNGAWHLLYSGPVANYSISGRAAGQWCYRVRAINNAGVGEWSRPQCLTVGSSALYLPLTSYNPVVAVPTPIPTPTWQRVGQGQLEVTTLAIQEDQLFVGDRRALPQGGLYRRSLGGCATAPHLARVDSISTNVLSLAFQQTHGLVGGDGTLFYSSNNGNSWTARPIRAPLRTAAVVVANNTLYAGAEVGGIFQSSTSDKNWQALTTKITEINALYFHTDTLWIGGEKSGVLALPPGHDDPIEHNRGLVRDTQRQVWDFVFVDSSHSFIATYDGVYQRIDDGAWQPFGLDGNKVRSLAVMNQNLYAGGVDIGVWHRPLDGSQNWQPTTAPDWKGNYTVRDLLYAPACQGLLAGTTDGVWVYRVP